MLTGTPGNVIGGALPLFESRVKGMLLDHGLAGRVKSGGDLFEFHQWLKNDPVDLIIGNSYGKYIARAEDTPLVRFGFPVTDRICKTYIPVCGYKGAIHLVEALANALLDRQDRDAADEDLELIM